MKELLERIGSYNIFNYLLPGVLFAVSVETIGGLNLLKLSPLVGAFVYYFIGSVISRVGSLIVEPIFLRLKIIRYAPYSNFVSASKNDGKIEVLSEVNNMYRTLCALVICVSAVKGFVLMAHEVERIRLLAPWLIGVGLIILYALAYRKQSDFIRKRVAATQKTEATE